MPETRSGTVYSAPELAPGALPMKKKKKKSKKKSPPCCNRCLAVTTEEEMKDLREFQRSIKDDEIRCSQCNYSAPVNELLSSFRDHFCQEHPAVITDVVQSDGACPYCNFHTDLEDDLEDQARELYAHMDAEHHEKTRAFVKEYFKACNHDNFFSNPSSAGLFDCKECEEIGYCTKTEDLCPQCFPFCDDCIRTRLLSTASSTDLPICDVLISASRQTEETIDDVDVKPHLGQAECLSQSLIESPSPVPDDGGGPCGVNPFPTPPFSHPVDPIPLTPAVKIDASCQTEETIDDASKLPLVQAESLPQTLVCETSSNPDNECDSSGEDPISTSDSPLCSESGAISSKLSPTATPFVPRTPDCSVDQPKRRRSRRRPRRRSRSRKRKKDSGPTPVALTQPIQLPSVTASALSTPPPPTNQQSPPVVTPTVSPSNGRRRSRSHCRSSRSRKKTKDSGPTPVALTQPIQLPLVTASALSTPPPPTNQQSPPVVTPPVSPSNGRRRSRSRSHSHSYNRNRSGDRKFFPDPFSSRKMTNSSVVEGRAPSSHSSGPVSTISDNNTNSRNESYSSAVWLPPPPVQETPLIPLRIENICGRIGKVYILLFGVKVPLGTVHLNDFTTLDDGNVRIHPLLVA